jgi:diketogulonate reductase-like aldo/keto reductase
MNIDSTFTLNNEVKIPIFGLGMYLSHSGEMARNAIQQALKCGYRHFDTASFYANEQDIGQIIREIDIPREEIFVTTKLWNDDHGYDSTRQALDLSLQQMQLEYVDLYLIHWPVEGLRLESWKALEKAYSEGTARAIGVSNYMINHLKELLENSQIVPAINQFEISPFNYQSRKDVIDYCRSQNIHVEAYSPLTKGRKIKDPDLIKIGEKYRKSSAQILIRWALEHQFIVIPKSSNEHRIRENTEVFDFELSQEDMDFLNCLDENLVTSWDPTNTA